MKSFSILPPLSFAAVIYLTTHGNEWSDGRIRWVDHAVRYCDGPDAELRFSGHCEKQHSARVQRIDPQSTENVLFHHVHSDVNRWDDPEFRDDPDDPQPAHQHSTRCFSHLHPEFVDR